MGSVMLVDFFLTSKPIILPLAPGKIQEDEAKKIFFQGGPAHKTLFRTN